MESFDGIAQPDALGMDDTSKTAVAAQTEEILQGRESRQLGAGDAVKLYTYSCRTVFVGDVWY